MTRIEENLAEAIDRLRSLGAEQAPPRWETPEQWKELTGEEWPEAWGVYTLFYGGWILQRYREAKLMGTYMPITIVCATEAGPPPEDWRPEGEE
jgi:hypothetical protein